MPRVGRAYPVQAPVGGWNARDEWDDMPKEDAIDLVNWFPTTDSVVSRQGYNRFAEGLAGQVEFIGEFQDGVQRQLLAAADEFIYNITTGTPVTLGSGFITARWQYVNFDGKIGLVNGFDAPQEWDGSTLSALTISGTGLAVEDLIDNEVYRSRVWYVEKDTQDVWYSAINTLGGVLTKFPLSRVGQFGGTLISVGTWTRDSGSGADDWIAFIMSSGEILVYTGDPATNFQLVGIFRGAEPLSTRCTLKYGANLWVFTRAGVVDMQSIMALGTAAFDRAITDKIKNAFTTQTAIFGPQFGWEPIYYPRQSMVLFNVPVNVDMYEQYVVNTRTGAWCRFTNMNAFSWSLFNDDLYFGGDGIVYIADTGFDDDGSNIECDGITAFNYLGARANKKQVTMIQPVLDINGDLADNITIGSDMEVPAIPSSTNIVQTASTPWGSPWGSPWGGGTERTDEYVGLCGWGYSFAMRLKIGTNKNRTKWYSNRWVFKSGGLV